MPVVENNQIEIIEIEQEIGGVFVSDTSEIVIEELGIELVEVSEPGPPGPPGEVDDYEESFSASLEWIVNHNLGRRPSVTLFTVGGVEFDANVIHPTINQCLVNFVSPIAGSVRAI